LDWRLLSCFIKPHVSKEGHGTHWLEEPHMFTGTMLTTAILSFHFLSFSKGVSSLQFLSVSLPSPARHRTNTNTNTILRPLCRPCTANSYHNNQRTLWGLPLLFIAARASKSIRFGFGESCKRALKRYIWDTRTDVSARVSFRRCSPPVHQAVEEGLQVLRVHVRSRFRGLLRCRAAGLGR
jgi:hypothetical protein